MSTLKPCPFCGGGALYTPTCHIDVVQCRVCGAQGMAAMGQPEAAIAAWNRRAEDDEVEKLRAEASEFCQKAQLFEDVAQRRKDERDALGIAFRKLSAVLRVNMLRHVPDTSHAEIDAAIDACVGPVARTASGDTP